MQLRPAWRGYVGHCLVLAMVAFLVFGPLTASAQSVNHAPVINSKPAPAVLAGAAYTYQLTAFDSDTDAVSYQLTTQPEGLTLVNSIISWQPTKVGTYNVVVQAADGKGGYDSQAWQIAVSPGAAASVIVMPNDRPTVVEIGQNRQFTAEVTDAYQNAIANPAITWSTDDVIGTVSPTGLFTPTRAGTGYVAAQTGKVRASVGVVAKDARADQVTISNTNAPSNTNSSGAAASIVNNVNRKNANTNVNAAENSNGAVSADTNTNSAPAAAESAPCTNPNHKLVISMLFAYAIILAVYYSYERRHKNGGWWIFPFLLTFIGVIVYYKYFCADTYLWWPWVLVISGVVLTLYYKLRRKPDMTQTELPF